MSLDLFGYPLGAILLYIMIVFYCSLFYVLIMYYCYLVLIKNKLN
jgi:hypothetical protein